MNKINCGVPIYDFPVPDWNKSKKQTFSMTPEKIVIHNTYNSAKAKAEASYMVGNSNWTSFHTVVDESAIYECIPFNRNAWHAGATYGNRHYIGIEIARSTGNASDFAKAEENAAKYTAAILKSKGWGIDRVVTHKYCSGKYCPHKTLDLGWNRFLDKVKKYLGQTPVQVNTNVSRGGYSVRTKTPGDVLNVRMGPGVGYRKVSSYRDGSKIYVEEVVKNIEGTWYKIPRVGYVSARYCVGIA